MSDLAQNRKQIHVLHVHNYCLKAFRYPNDVTIRGNVSVRHVLQGYVRIAEIFGTGLIFMTPR